MHPDARHLALRDGCPRSLGIVSLCAGLSDACLHHSVAGSGHMFRPRYINRQAFVGTPLRRRSGFVHAVPSTSVFVFTYLHTRYGDSGAVCGFADNLWKICWFVGA